VDVLATPDTSVTSPGAEAFDRVTVTICVDGPAVDVGVVEVVDGVAEEVEVVVVLLGAAEDVVVVEEVVEDDEGAAEDEGVTTAEVDVSAADEAAEDWTGGVAVVRAVAGS